MGEILSPKFFQKPALVVARDLIGKYLVRKISGKILRYKITETEAYVGEHDLACHASKGKTPRTEVMFEEGGVFYVYFVYGTHHMLNIVTGKKNCPEAVLIRGLEGLSGPARLTKALQIDLKFKGREAKPETDLWFERGGKISEKFIKKTSRIGVDYAGPIWSKKPYRFVLSKMPLKS